MRGHYGQATPVVVGTTKLEYGMLGGLGLGGLALVTGHVGLALALASAIPLVFLFSFGGG